MFTADHGEMMGERGMWYKQHFFEWAAGVPLVIHAPKRWQPSRVKQNVSLIDLMPTMLDAAVGKPFDDYVGDGIDGKSLVPALESHADRLDDIAISEFAADGSTGPSRMVKKGPWKYMYLEGVEELLYNVEDDPKELDNKIADPAAAAVAEDLRAIALDGWDPDTLRDTIRRDQEHRLLIHETTGGEPTWVNIIRYDDNDRYIRNAGAADTKAKARLPYVAPAKPDKIG